MPDPLDEPPVEPPKDALDELPGFMREPLLRRFLEQEHRPFRAARNLFDSFGDGRFRQYRSVVVQAFFWAWLPLLLASGAAAGGLYSSVMSTLEWWETRKANELTEKQDVANLWQDARDGQGDEQAAALQALYARGVRRFTGIECATWPPKSVRLSKTEWVRCSLRPTGLAQVKMVTFEDCKIRVSPAGLGVVSDCDFVDCDFEGDGDHDRYLLGRSNDFTMCRFGPLEASYNREADVQLKDLDRTMPMPIPTATTVWTATGESEFVDCDLCYGQQLEVFGAATWNHLPIVNGRNRTRHLNTHLDALNPRTGGK